MMEADLNTLLKAICSRVFPDVAPSGTALPYVTWQSLGGESRYTLANTPIDKRNTLMQINVWSATRKEANTLARAIESAVTASPTFVATPEGEPASVHEEDTGLYGAIQRYSIWSAR